MIIIGIDPGLKGGVALYREEYRDWYAIPMPASKGIGIDVRAIGSTLGSYVNDWSALLAVVEKVHAMPKQGVTSTFTFGMGYGKILGMLEALGIPYITPTPQQWKKRILEGTTKDKDAAIAYVTAKYPMISLKATPRCTNDHDGMADAICLCEYGMKEVKG